MPYGWSLIHIALRNRNALGISGYDGEKVAQLSSGGQENPLHGSIFFGRAIETALEKTG
jgi:hypothetical protein